MKWDGMTWMMVGEIESTARQNTYGDSSSSSSMEMKPMGKTAGSNGKDWGE